jgi:hypothetical protein
MRGVRRSHSKGYGDDEQRRSAPVTRMQKGKLLLAISLGVSLKTAIQHAASSKSYWHMARTPGVQQALSNAWLKTQGLVSVKEQWCKAQGYTT